MPGLLFTSAPGRRWCVKAHTTLQWLNQLPSSSTRSSGHSWSMVSRRHTLPQLSLSLCCTETSSNQTTAKCGLLGGTLQLSSFPVYSVVHLVPLVQCSAAHSPHQCLVTMLHTIPWWFITLFGFCGSWAGVYQQNTHSLQHQAVSGLEPYKMPLSETLYTVRNN